MSNLTFDQRTFGNKGDWRFSKMKTIITNPTGTLTLTHFDDQPNRLALILSLFPDNPPKNPLATKRAILKIQNKYGECPDDVVFWEWYISVREGRNTTLQADFTTMLKYLQLNSYYSKSYMHVFLNYRLRKRDGVRRSDLVLSEEEIGFLLRKEFNLAITTERVKQIALDIFIMTVFTGARMRDVRSLVKSTDAKGNQIMMYHNRKGTRTQTVAWFDAMEGPLRRGLYNSVWSNGIIYPALKAALYEALPTSSNRLINFYYLRPGKGREIKSGSRIAHMGFHTARHTFCTRLLRIGVSLSVIAQLAGHKSINTTMKYYNWTREDEANDVLREVYKNNSVLSRKPDWGEGASSVKPLPQFIHEKQTIHPTYLGELLPDDGGLVAKSKEVIKRRKLSKRQLDILERRKR